MALNLKLKFMVIFVEMIKIRKKRNNKNLPTKTEIKNKSSGMSSIGEVIFKNQFGVMGNKRKNNNTYIKVDRFSSTFCLSDSIRRGKYLTI